MPIDNTTALRQLQAPQPAPTSAIHRMRKPTTADRILGEIQQMMLTLWGGHQGNTDVRSLYESEAEVPGFAPVINSSDRFPGYETSASLLRVDHSGEVAAQALYRGQALTTLDYTLRAELLEAADEEIDHLLWCAQRLADLGDAPSRLCVVWYTGSFILGVCAGTLAPNYALGFVEETELQVALHLDDHLSRLPAADWRSAIVLNRMRLDEQRHADWARNSHSHRPPHFMRALMTACAKVMTVSSYRF